MACENFQALKIYMINFRARANVRVAGQLHGGRVSPCQKLNSGSAPENHPLIHYTNMVGTCNGITFY